eukprot:Skav218020  [mRNA]  locus=scaffold2344:289738:295642:- [translate_table: standard]
MPSGQRLETAWALEMEAAHFQQQPDEAAAATLLGRSLANLVMAKPGMTPEEQLEDLQRRFQLLEGEAWNRVKLLLVVVVTRESEDWENVAMKMTVL